MASRYPPRRDQSVGRPPCRPRRSPTTRRSSSASRPTPPPPTGTPRSATACGATSSTRAPIPRASSSATTRTRTSRRSDNGVARQWTLGVTVAPDGRERPGTRRARRRRARARRPPRRRARRLWVLGATASDDAELAALRPDRPTATCTRCAYRSRSPSRDAPRRRRRCATFVPGRDDAAWLAVNNRAFAGHEEQGDWIGRHARAAAWPNRGSTPRSSSWPTTAPASPGSTGARCTPQPRSTRELGEIYVIGVDPRTQGTGLGRALAVAGLDAARRARHHDRHAVLSRPTTSPRSSCTARSASTCTASTARTRPRSRRREHTDALRHDQGRARPRGSTCAASRAFGPTRSTKVCSHSAGRWRHSRTCPSALREAARRTHSRSRSSNELSQQADNGTTLKWLWRGRRRRPDRDRADAVSRARDGVRLVASRAARWAARSARPGRPGSSGTSTSARSSSRCCARSTRRRNASRTSCSWAWASRSPTSTRCSNRAGASTPMSGSRRATSRCRPSASCPAWNGSPSSSCPSRWRFRCTRPTTRCATELVPLNRRYPIAEVLDAARAYAARKGRRVTFEYACISGVNDLPHHADALAGRLTGLRGGAHVNLIPLNSTGGYPGRPSTARAIEAFARRCGPAAYKPASAATAAPRSTPACGQLRARAGAASRARRRDPREWTRERPPLGQPAPAADALHRARSSATSRPSSGSLRRR